ncbi:hypothetical protein BDW69DRAFT_155544 [Aspergillus filifer]
MTASALLFLGPPLLGSVDTASCYTSPFPMNILYIGAIGTGFTACFDCQLSCLDEGHSMITKQQILKDACTWYT